MAKRTSKKEAADTASSTGQTTTSKELVEELEATTTMPGEKRTKRLKPIDIAAIIVITAVVALLSWTIYSKLTLKHDVNAAQKVSNETIAALHERDGAAARKLGTEKFKQTYTDKKLTEQFRAIESTTNKTPVLVDTTVYNGEDGRSVYFIYRYDVLKVPFFVRVGVTQTSDGWKLLDISGSANKSELLIAN